MSTGEFGVPPPQAAVGYFIDQKKGEVNELKQVLKNLNIEKDARRKREVVKKVIAYMTLGIDVSRLFTDMIMAIETKDIVVKKMVYLYLSNYAHSEPEMAIMCINSLRRDCDNEDPLVRGLALRSLCSLRLESILEYVEQPLQKAFHDISAYVRKTAVIAVLKINQLSPSLVKNNGYLRTLYTMLQDTDANVVTNAIYVVNELQIEGGLEVTQPILMGLLNRIGEFSEWGLNVILDLVSRYVPANEDEVFGIMNLLDPVLRTANSGSVLATMKCFFNLTLQMPDMQQQIIARSKPPLLTLITGSFSESQYMTLKHVQNILHQPSSKGVFDDEYRQFFVRYNEPPHVKHLKVELLPLISNRSNARDIATELSEYVTDVDVELSKRAIRALGEIASRIEEVSEEMTTSLVQLMDIDSNYIRAEAAKVLCDVVRIYPRLSDLILPGLGRNIRRVDDHDAKASLIWMLGEFGGNIVEAPYAIESIIDNYENEESTTIKLQVLTAAMKLFFTRPPEMQAMLGRLLKKALNDTSNQDLHDRSLLYYRLLTFDPTGASALFANGASCNSIDIDFAERKDLELKVRLFSEFNTLAIVFGSPSENFIGEKFQLKVDTSSRPINESRNSAPQALLAPQLHASAPAVVGSVNLLDWEDSIAPPQALVTQPYQLRSMTDLITPAAFQTSWISYPDVFNATFCKLSVFPTSILEIQDKMRFQNIYTIASGVLPNNSGYKLFAYGVEVSSGASILMQMLLSASTKEVGLVLKSDQSTVAIDQYLVLISAILSSFG